MGKVENYRDAALGGSISAVDRPQLTVDHEREIRAGSVGAGQGVGSGRAPTARMIA